MSQQSVVDRVSELSLHLERAIVSGDLSVGELLPAERALSAQFQVSRSVVREALGRLASLGLVESRPGSGTRVTTPTSRQVSLGFERLLRKSAGRLTDLARVRLVLESSIAAEAARCRTPQHLAKLEEQQEILHNPRRSLAAHVRADGLFHLLLAEATGNPFFSLVLEPIHDLLTESRLKTLRKFGAAIAHQHHDRILEAVRAGDAAEAACAMEQHLQVNSRHLQELAEQGGDRGSVTVAARSRRRVRVPR